MPVPGWQSATSSARYSYCPRGTLDVPAHTFSAQTPAPAVALAFDPSGTRLAIGRGDQRRHRFMTCATPVRIVQLEQDGRIAPRSPSHPTARTSSWPVTRRCDDGTWPCADNNPRRSSQDPERILAFAPVTDGARLALGLEVGVVEVRSSGRVIEQSVLSGPWGADQIPCRSRRPPRCRKSKRPRAGVEPGRSTEAGARGLHPPQRSECPRLPAPSGRAACLRGDYGGEARAMEPRPRRHLRRVAR